MVNDPSPVVLEKQNRNVSTEKLKITKTHDSLCLRRATQTILAFDHWLDKTSDVAWGSEDQTSLPNTLCFIAQK